MKKILQFILKILAELVLERYEPDIIAITGSVGKSSTKEAVAQVLRPHFNIRENAKNYNNEIGVPLTILGQESGNKSLWRWLGIFLAAIKLLIIRDKNYPDILILEMGADRPGDIRYLVNFIHPSIGIVTAVAPSHIEFFGTLERIAMEKREVVAHLDRQGTAILNADDSLVILMKEKTRAPVLSFGFGEKADVRAEELQLSYSDDNAKKEILGINFKMSHKGSFVPVFLPRIIGRQQVYSALAGAAAGITYGLNLVQISEALRNYRAPRGRMNLIAGINNSLIIDDSYNSSPEAVKAALGVLAELRVPGARKIAVLGDMLELGDYSYGAHREIGFKIVELGLDMLVTVGERSKAIAMGAEEAGLAKSAVSNFPTSREAGEFLINKIKANDIILVKGSQGMRMERVVKEIIAEPARAGELLARQEKKWLNS